jgi:hypothetical protein
MAFDARAKLARVLTRRNCDGGAAVAVAPHIRNHQSISLAFGH